MSRDRTIIISQDNFKRLRTLSGHPRLATQLQHASVVDSEHVPADVVTMNSRVRFEDRTAGTIRDVTIVFPLDAEPSTTKLSVLATVGTALLGRSVGQSIPWPFPDGSTRSLRVLKLISQPESEREH